MMDYTSIISSKRCIQKSKKFALCTCAKISQTNDYFKPNNPKIASYALSFISDDTNNEEIASSARSQSSTMSPDLKLATIIKMMLIIRTIFRTVQKTVMKDYKSKNSHHYQQCNFQRSKRSGTFILVICCLAVNCLLVQVPLAQGMDLDGSSATNGVNSLASSENHRHSPSSSSASNRQSHNPRVRDDHDAADRRDHHDMDDDNDSSEDLDDSHHHLFNGNHVREPLVLSSQHQQQSNAINRNGDNSNNDESSNSRNINVQQNNNQQQEFHPVYNGQHSLHNNQLLNYTLMLQELERGCSSFCADQIKFSSVCIAKGCRNWKTGLRQGCSVVCNGSENNFREFDACQVGCSKAIEEYYFRVTGLIGVPDPPTLISDSLKSSSLRLSWEGSALPLPYLVFTVQRRIFPRTSQWETMPMSQSTQSSSTSSSSLQQQQLQQQSPLNTTTFTVTSLKPYTDYQFRIGWILAHGFPPYYSRESNPIQTLPDGLPNPPEITSIQPISNTSVSVTWLPPSQPNGRLIAYILKLRKLPDGNIIIKVEKDIPISQNPRGYTFTGLQPITNYSLEISAQNNEGEGETANIQFVTPQTSLSNDISEKPEPRLLLQGIKDVYMQHLDLLLDPDVFVYNSSQNISATACHVKYKWVFIATDDGDIIRTNLDQSQSRLIVSKDRLDLEVAFLAVDWLHDHLYIVGKKRRSTNWSIKKCDLNGNNLVAIYTYLFERPVDFAVDPFTGFLYWVSPLAQLSRGGLYKLNLVPEDFSTGPYPVPVIEGQDFGPFVVDSVNYRILIVHKGRNTVLAVSLDGDASDIRHNTQSPRFEDALSIAWYNGIFYWTTGQSVVIEEYNAAQDSYYQNLYDVPKVHQPCTRIMIVHPDLQPTPVPMAPPQRVQVIYGQTRARVSWRPPPVISGLGDGSWRRWSYQIRMTDNNISYENITNSEFIIQNLQPSTSYTIQVAAASPAGRGPWSPPVRGKSLRETQYNITFLWGSQSGLYTTNTLGENVELLASPTVWLGGNNSGYYIPSTDKFFPQSTLQPFGNPTFSNSPSSFMSQSLYMSSLTWFDSLVFFALSNGSVFYYDTVNVIQERDQSQGSVNGKRNEITRLAGIPNAQSIAFDYIGQKLYWSNPKQQTILRCSFIHGSYGKRDNLAMNVDTVNPCTVREKAERLQVVTMARELCVDSYKGMLIWSTGHSLELARLNGYSHRVLYQTGLFSGINIMGITLDTDQSRIYWITRSSTGSTLQRLNYNSRGGQEPVVIASYDDTSITGPIRYFNDRLIWLQGPSEAVITDLFGQGKSSLRINTISNITNLHVRDQSAQRYPEGLSKSKIQVYPDAIPMWTIGISGKWNNFTISWTPVNNTNYGKILYEVIVNNSISKITASPNVTIDNGTLFKPYTDLDITITSSTFWASSKPVSKRLKTPSWRPSEPLNPRVFVQKLSYPYLPSKMVNNLSTGGLATSVSVELRWDVPQQPNGVILGYLTHCWKDTMKKTDCNCEMERSRSQQQPSCRIQHLSPFSRYYFAIQAYTENGAGNLSSKILADTNFNTPVPNLMLVTADKLQILDIDRNDVRALPLGYLSPMTAVHFAKEDTVFWFNEGQDLMWSKVDTAYNNKTRIMSLASLRVEASNLVVDWIGRKLYWAYETTATSPPATTTLVSASPSANLDERYGIMSFDLVPNWGLPQEPKVVITSKTPIRSVAVNPFKKSLYWTTAKRQGITTLLTSDFDGVSTRSFLSRDPVTCNCSTLSTTGEPIAYDPHGLGNAAFPSGILFMDKQTIWLGDDNGCNCVRLANLNTLPFLQYSPYRITADEQHVYWAEGSLFASEKMGNGGYTELQPVGAGIREVTVFGPISQPFPDLNCLLPQKMEPTEPILFNHSSHSLHLKLPKLETVNCTLGEVSLPTPKYNVYYGTVNENGISECTPTSSSFCKVVTTLETMLHITDLYPYTTYTVFVTVTNYYAEQENERPLGCSPIMLRTAPGAPMPPILLRVEPLTPVAVRVFWRQPEKLNGEKVWYEVHWKNSGSRASSPKYNGQKWAETETRSNHNRTEYYLDLIDLIPESNYTIWVVAYSEKGDAFSESERMFVTTFPHPNNITLVKASPHNLSIEWMPPNDTSILRHQIMYRNGWSAVWNMTETVNFTIPYTRYKMNITNLKPKTLYGFRIRTWYIGNPDVQFDWPAEGQFSYETLADKPGIPGKPIARGIGRSLYEITWEKAPENGAEIELYSLECKVEIDQSIILAGSGSNGAPTETGLNQNTSLDYILLNTTGTGSGGSSTNSSQRQLNRQKRDTNKNVVESTSAAEKLISSDGPDSQRNFIGVYLQWVTVYNGTETRWQVEGLDINKQYNFRVRAKNVYGWGEYSQETISVSLAALTLVAETQGFGIVLGCVFLACLTLGTCALLTLFLYRGRLKEKPILNGTMSSSERREVELATLREMPGGSTFIHQSNILYAGDLLLDMDFAGIPKIHRHQISLTKFLGSGAFGEVYEGIAAGLLSPHEDTRVAIKTLRKGANNIEKVEFIEEAKLMMQFQHPHIIKLMGICLDTDPCCLLLELMSGGDLLSYLRSHRPNLGSTTSLTIVDLLNMCVDVAKGCVYLEEMHYVHRDLATRNCLVQIENAVDGESLQEEGGGGGNQSPQQQMRRVVKIGDFGLARDIYRNDYYRKEGEGLLPVRWMAPESLVDGVFTTQSDVWAFGVIIWEIMTLGQQPYPARTNLEVLQYVRGGGRLHQPPHCPQHLSQLMFRCWEYNPDNRPTFRECQAELENILQSWESIMTSGHQNQPSPSSSATVSTTPDNPDEIEDEYGFRSSTNAEVHPHPLTTSQQRRLNYRTESAPKYIEVIAEPESGSEQLSPHSPQSLYTGSNGGYEIPLPRKPPRRKAGGDLSFSASGSQPSSHFQTPAEYGLPSPKYWNVDVSSPFSSSSYNFKRTNSASSNHPLLHRSSSGGGGGVGSCGSSSSSVLRATPDTRKDSVEDVQYTVVSCPDYQLHLSKQYYQHHHPLSVHYQNHHGNQHMEEGGTMGGVVTSSTENKCSVEARMNCSPEAAGGDSSSSTTTTAENSPVYAYSYKSIPVSASSSNFPQNLDYHRHNINSPQGFSRQTIDTCGSG